METSGENCIKSRVFWVRNVRNSQNSKSQRVGCWGRRTAITNVSSQCPAIGASTKRSAWRDSRSKAAARKTQLCWNRLDLKASR